MALPTTRDEFKEYCLRNLGKPVITINVDDTQVEDRIDDALQMWWEYHYDGTERTYYKHQITSTDVTNGYITIPDNIIGAVRLLPAETLVGAAGVLSAQFQFTFDMIYNLNNANLTGYFLKLQHLELVDRLLNGVKEIRYNKAVNRLYIDTQWSAEFVVGNWLVVEAYQIVDPNDYADVWKDIWLRKYATALIKRSWGNNLKKFDNMQLPGGVSFNGQQIYDEAVTEVKEMEDEMINKYSLPVFDIMA